MGRELREGLGSLINEHDDTGYKSHWYSIEHTMATKKKKNTEATEDEDKKSISVVQYGCSFKGGGWTLCAVQRKQVDGPI